MRCKASLDQAWLVLEGENMMQMLIYAIAAFMLLAIGGAAGFFACAMLADPIEKDEVVD